MYDANKLQKRIEQFKNKVSDQDNMIKNKVNEIDAEISKVEGNIDSELKKLVKFEMSKDTEAQEKSNKLLYDLRYKLNDLKEKKSMYLTVKDDKSFVKDEIQQILDLAKQVSDERHDEKIRIIGERAVIEEKIYELKQESDKLARKSELLDIGDDAYKFSGIMSYIPNIESVPNSQRNLYINDLISGRDVSRYFAIKDFAVKR